MVATVKEGGREGLLLILVFSFVYYRLDLPPRGGNRGQKAFEGTLESFQLQFCFFLLGLLGCHSRFPRKGRRQPKSG